VYVSKREAVEVVNNIIRLGIATGKHRMGLAANLVYLSCNKTGKVEFKQKLQKQRESQG
jgi:hypothetical protein